VVKAISDTPMWMMMDRAIGRRAICETGRKPALDIEAP